MEKEKKEAGVIKKACNAVCDGFKESYNETKAVSKAMHADIKEKTKPKNVRNTVKEGLDQLDEQMAAVNPYVKTKIEIKEKKS